MKPGLKHESDPGIQVDIGGHPPIPFGSESGQCSTRILQDLLNGRGGIPDQEQRVLNNTQSQLNR